MVLAVKYLGTDASKYKVIIAVHGQKNKEKVVSVQNSPIVIPMSLRMFLTSAAIERFRIWATDIQCSRDNWDPDNWYVLKLGTKTNLLCSFVFNFN